MSAQINLPDPEDATDDEVAAAIEAHRASGIHATPQPPRIGSGGQDAVAGNDPRLTNQREPINASVTMAKLATDVLAALGGDVEGAVEEHREHDVHDQPQPPIIGSGANQAVAGHDARLTNQRVPIDASVTLAKLAPEVVDELGGDVDAKIEQHRESAVHAVPQPPRIGSGATDAVAGNDSRLTDTRIPTDQSVTANKLESSLASTITTASTTAAANATEIATARSFQPTLNDRVVLVEQRDQIKRANFGVPRIITHFQPGHGWTLTGLGAGTLATDPSMPGLESGMLKLVTDGAGGVGSATKTGLDPVSLQVGRAARFFATTAESIQQFGRLYFYAASTGGLAGGNYLKWEVLNSNTYTLGATQYFIPQSSSTITPIVLHTADAQITGNPDRSAITEWKIEIADRGSVARTMFIGGLDTVPTGLSAFGTNGVVTITFDDGFLSQSQIARKVLGSHGYQATFLPIIEKITGAASSGMSLANLRDLVARGHEVGIHSYSQSAHDNYANLTTTQALADLRQAQEWLNSNDLGRTVMAYPQGSFTPYDQITRKLVACCRTTGGGRTLLHESLPPQDMQRLRAISSVGGSGSTAYPTANVTGVGGLLDKCAAENSWLTLVFHNITTGAAAQSIDCSQSDLQAIFDGIASRGIQVATLGQVTDAIIGGNGTAPYTGVGVEVDGTAVATRRKIAVFSGTNTAVVPNDNAGDDTVELTISATAGGTAGVTLIADGSTIGTRSGLEIEAGTGIDVTATDIPGSNRTKARIDSTVSLSDSAPLYGGVTDPGSNPAAARDNHVHPRYTVDYTDYTSYKGESSDPLVGVQNYGTPNNGVPFVSMMRVKAGVISNVYLYMGSAGSGLTNCSLGVYLFNGLGVATTQLGVASSIASTFSSGSNARKTVALDSPTASVADGALIFVVPLFNQSGGSLPTIGRATTASGILGSPISRRYGHIGSAVLSALPSSFIPTNLITSGFAYWAAVD